MNHAKTDAVVSSLLWRGGEDTRHESRRKSHCSSPGKDSVLIDHRQATDRKRRNQCMQAYQLERDLSDEEYSDEPGNFEAPTVDAVRSENEYS